ncbi:hypothetical protein P7K49_003885 [Saguinus oedipus]|uniref:Uncharacterized protein n=1 Tax=Saguinus oedipus TaxID=9490 RepID=A0ABQ9W5U0_SAGOE|nr:hypothetical protein P7K49_003885 [Saguinus oedipus]
MAAKEKLEAVLNVALRVPSIMLLDVLYRWDVSSFFQQIQRSSLNNNPLFQYNVLQSGKEPFTMDKSPAHSLKQSAANIAQAASGSALSIFFDCSAPLCRTSDFQHSQGLAECGKDYVRSELEFAYEGPMYLEPLSMNRFTTALIGCTLLGDISNSGILKSKEHIGILIYSELKVEIGKSEDKTTYPFGTSGGDSTNNMTPSST